MEGKVSYTASDIPELVAFLHKEDCHVYKDICIDGEVHCQQTYRGENWELDSNNIPCIMHYETKQACLAAPERVLYITAKAESFPQHDCRMDGIKQYNSDKPETDDKAEFAEVVDSNSLQKDSPERTKDKQNQDHCQPEAILKGIVFGSNLDSKSSKVDSNEPNKIIGTCGILQNVDSQQPPKSENTSKVEDRKAISTPAASKVSQNTEGLPHHVGSPPSDNLLSSGRIQRPDSISFHSTSSATTSARSFAFPILSSEWPSSPVRMVGGDHHARFKKQRRWKTCFCW